MNKFTETHFEGKITQKVIIEKDDEILLVQDPHEKRDIWELPGGRMNVDEEPREAMRREFREEMGVDIKVHEVVHMEQFVQGNEGKKAFVIVYRATLSDTNKQFEVAEAEVSEVKWVDKREVLNFELYPEHKRTLEKYLK